MHTDHNTIDEIFSENGLLARSLPEYEYRRSQPEMARLIERALSEKTQVIVEAGTGVGKTMGYLIPLLISGMKGVVSTGTKNLQEQIFYKDIPLVSRAVGIRASALLMKGRRNYLCLYRYHQYFTETLFPDPARENIRRKLEKWLDKTESGDRAELKWLKDDDPLWDAVTCSSHQCRGPECVHRQECFISRLHRLAAKADIIIVNHHLFFADMMIKKGGFGEIIPRSQVIVFDEAHGIEEIATTYLGERVSTGQLLELVHDVEKEDTSRRKKDGNLSGSLISIKSGIDNFEKIFEKQESRGRLNVLKDFETYREPVSRIKKGLLYLKGYREPSIAGRAEELEDSLTTIFSSESVNGLDWYEKGKRGVTFNLSPLDIAEEMRQLLYKKVKSIVFTSATISTNKSFDYIRSRLGLPEDALEGMFPSHFDLKSQALLYIAKDLPAPNSADFGIRIAERIIEILRKTLGRALVLFTSYNNLNIVYDRIKEEIPYTLFKQGDAPKTVLLEKFRKDTHSVLMATGSFWQGVDVPGESLSCLIIDKLPFDSPGDPLVAARIGAIRERGGNPFMEYQVPGAIISFKQGMGRLIRKGSDRGVLAVLDSRIIKSGYGKYFIRSLPEIPISHETGDIGKFFNITG